MKKSPVSVIPIQQSCLSTIAHLPDTLISLTLELTARCNNSCNHCYNNLPPTAEEAQKQELSLAEIQAIIEQALPKGLLWVLLTGGEPLLREDFADIYTYLKKKGLLVTVFTNATLITDEHIRLFKQFPPRDLEITVYGASPRTYTAVTRTSANYDKFIQGIELLSENAIPFRLKTMALASNSHEFAAIREFCQKYTKDYFYFDFQLHLRPDNHSGKNKTITKERLSPAKILELEWSDPARSKALQKECGTLIQPDFLNNQGNSLFRCGVGTGSAFVGYDGILRLCQSLCHEEYTCNLRHRPLIEAWSELRAKARAAVSHSPEFLENCNRCQYINLCMWCPALAHLETGRLDATVETFCRLAEARAAKLTGA
jgi:radical SAM protein with 4Fe4S-binding SPASM domain